MGSHIASEEEQSKHTISNNPIPGNLLNREELPQCQTIPNVEHPNQTSDEVILNEHPGLYQTLFNVPAANSFMRGQLLSYQIYDPSTSTNHQHYCIWIDKYVIFEFKFKSNEVDIRPLSEEDLKELTPEDRKPSPEAHIRCMDLMREQYNKIRMHKFTAVSESTCECKEKIERLYN